MAYLINFVDRALGVREREGAQILHVTFYYPYGLAYRAALDSIKVYGILHHLITSVKLPNVSTYLYFAKNKGKFCEALTKCQ